MVCQCPKIYTVFSIITLLLQRLWRQKIVNWSEIELHKHSSNHYPVDRKYFDFELFAYFCSLFLKLLLQLVHPSLGHRSC